ncbi:DUF4846 domain-containing protein [Carboxylicivirga sp. N1Y90]|uniref:DUF4846 domain-containing protein n=1 Tax=Carboxylicivirga fragile TaxID=3417571 RepID=UPI003D33FC29|nr:DUF4846 domain-containing protein [Marinilabiliaceae bacterium N1Y90]
MIRILLLFIAFNLGVLGDIQAQSEKGILSERFEPPVNYQRPNCDSKSFVYFLQHLPLKPEGSVVKYYNGASKNTPEVYCAVVDLEVGNRDLLQCADACMLLYAEYLFKQKRYDEIAFDFVSDGKPRYYNDYTDERTYKSFRKYMNYIFAYANTRSLYNQLKPVSSIMQLKAGDVFIQTGNPYGHAVMVVDVAINAASGKKVYLLAQSYMPAQEIQILINPMNSSLSPWYELNELPIQTPEWKFIPADLRRFE